MEKNYENLKMYCTQDCTCSLCRELRGFNIKPAIVSHQSKHNAGPSNDNFILRRRLSDTDDAKAPVRIVDSVQKKTLTKSKSYSELWKRFDPRNASKKKVKESKTKDCSKKTDGHKVIIYFGDSIPHKRQPLTPYKTDGEDFEHARRLCKEIDDEKSGSKSTKVLITKDEGNAKKRADDHAVKALKPEVDVMMQLKTVLNQKINKSNNDVSPVSVNKTVVALPPGPIKLVDKSCETKNGDDISLPSFIESVVNGVVNVKFENNFVHASELVKCISNAPGSDVIDDYFDWSFVQEWRTR